jgi:hypothetical protein
MVRAKMSDRESRGDVRAFDMMSRPAGDAYTVEDIWSIDAEREARAILAETEPEAGDGPSPFNPKATVAHESCCVALAESLDAFVANTRFA